MKNKTLYRLSFLCGLIPLIGGLFIFFTWWLARALFASDLNSLEGYGFLWILISIPIALTGLLFVFIFFFKNYPNYLKESGFSLVVILINVPIVNWIGNKQFELDKRAYIKISNETMRDNITLTLKASDFEKNFGSINNHESIVGYYYPKYIYLPDKDRYPHHIDTVTLIIQEKTNTYYLKLPEIYKGQCERFYIDKKFQLHNEFQQ